MARARSDQSYGALARELFASKERWHQDQARLSFSDKLRVLDRLRANANSLPKLVRRSPRSDA